MRKNVFGRQFKRDANERKALFKNLLTSLVMHERIKTTQEKAKAIRGAADRLVTKAKKGGPDAYRRLHPDINQDAVRKMIDEIAPRFMNRAGGYTRIYKIAKRRIADNAAMVVMEWVEKSAPTSLKLRLGQESESLQLDAANKKGEKADKKEKKAVKKSNKKVVDIIEGEIVVEPKAKGKKVAKKVK